MVELSYLAEPGREALQGAYEHIEETSVRWVASANEEENRALWSAIWEQAPRVWLGRPAVDSIL